MAKKVTVKDESPDVRHWPSEQVGRRERLLCHFVAWHVRVCPAPRARPAYCLVDACGARRRACGEDAMPARRVVFF
jgi:hypothetical protein